MQYNINLYIKNILKFCFEILVEKLDPSSFVGKNNYTQNKYICYCQQSFNQRSNEFSNFSFTFAIIGTLNYLIAYLIFIILGKILIVKPRTAWYSIVRNVCY